MNEMLKRDSRQKKKILQALGSRKKIKKRREVVEEYLRDIEISKDNGTGREEINV